MKKDNFFYLLIAIFFNTSSLACGMNCDNIENKWVIIVSKDSKKALDSCDPNDNNQVGKCRPHTPSHQHYKRHLWMLKAVNGYHVIFSKDSKKALVSLGTVNDDKIGKHPLLSTNDGGYEDYALWRIKKVNKNYYTIISKVSEKALDSCDPNDNRVVKCVPHFPKHDYYNRHLWKISIAPKLKDTL
jgi:hypothetical protein